jgi:CheY-like chemotaxis protein
MRELLVHHFTREGYLTVPAPDGPTALRAVRNGAEIAIVDVGLPVVDGLEIVRTVRAEGRRLPLLIVSARGEETDRVVGLELGADDYVPKPFSPREVVARVLSSRPTAFTTIGSRSTRPPARRASMGASSDSNLASSTCYSILPDILASQWRARCYSSRYGAMISTVTNGRSTSISVACARSSAIAAVFRRSLRRSTASAISSCGTSRGGSQSCQFRASTQAPTRDR